MRAYPIAIVGVRFLQVFHDHGIEVSQIPRILPQIRLADLQSPQHLIAALTPELLAQTAQMFGVRLEWLEGVDDQIYEHLSAYKRPQTFLEHLAALRQSAQDPLRHPVRVLTVAKRLDWRNPVRQPLAPVVLEKIAELGEEPIYRYHVFQDGCDWSYSPSRIELKSIVKVLSDRLGITVPLFVIGAKDMEEVLEGRLIPRRFVDGCLVTDPSLEDYVFTPERSGVAKEAEELPVVLACIEEHRLMEFSFEHVEDSPPDAPVSESESRPSSTVKASAQNGKRAQAETEIWAPISSAAITLWGQDSSLPIAEVVRRIKKTPAFKASAFSDSAIRKRIADLAPEGVRGKPGRKPKQSS
ncbi:hypothetical protein CKO20_13175 [Rhodocyclus tenuis]|nr:hypothetical protein [Rhodocyclus tenuis]